MGEATWPLLAKSKVAVQGRRPSVVDAHPRSGFSVVAACGSWPRRQCLVCEEMPGASKDPAENAKMHTISQHKFNSTLANQESINAWLWGDTAQTPSGPPANALPLAPPPQDCDD
eukprot:294517-Amphidinium_carterae.2